MVLAACSKEPHQTGTGFVFGTPSPAGQLSPPPPEVGGEVPGNPDSPGTMLVTLVDQNDLNPENIPVRVSGPVNQTINSDSKGRVKITGPAGDYALQIAAGCTARLQITGGASGRARIVGGVEGQGQLGVAWNHRHGPDGSSYSSSAGYWPVGQTIEVSFDMIDRCDKRKAPGAGYPTFNFQPSGNLQIIGTPTKKADENAQGHLSVRCTSPGDVSLFVVDSRNPPDRRDLIEHMGDFGPRPQCRNS
jgi:hypothetical protein